jgi:hypothetical protein
LHPAAIKKVKKKNHNHGKQFYSCSQGKCHYFEWVHDEDQKLNSALSNFKRGFLLKGDAKQLEKLDSKTIIKNFCPY